MSSSRRLIVYHVMLHESCVMGFSKGAFDQDGDCFIPDTGRFNLPSLSLMLILLLWAGAGAGCKMNQLTVTYHNRFVSTTEQSTICHATCRVQYSINILSCILYCTVPGHSVIPTQVSWYICCDLVQETHTGTVPAGNKIS